jgi:hypothetical protein
MGVAQNHSKIYFQFASIIDSGYKKERNLFVLKGMEKILILQEPIIAK